ncbi:putative ATP binding protein of ABC transporter [Escherichia coli TA054]|nr:putative ATP binding protein of ABC transporter [Escherichia coli TA054]
MKISISKVSIFQFFSLLFLTTLLFIISGGVSHQDGPDSIKEVKDYSVTKLQGKPILQIPNKEATWLTVAGATALYPLYSSAYHQVVVEPSWHSILHTRTPEAYDKLINYKTDVIFVAQPSNGQKKRAKDADIKLIYTPFARDAFVFIVNANNPVSSLSEQQIQDIFSGKITHWSQIGGSDQSIQIWQRPEDSGSQTIMQAEVMKGKQMLPLEKSTEISLMAGVIHKVAAYQNTQNSIGYTFRYYATQMNKNLLKDIKLLAVNGITPSSENICNGTYPYIVDAYMVTREKSTPQARKFVDWFLTPQGQQLVQDVGYVPLYKILSDVR